MTTLRLWPVIGALFLGLLSPSACSPSPVVESDGGSVGKAGGRKGHHNVGSIEIES